jgi:hypothetical protein
MIQRIQTVYLFLVVIISVIYMTGTIITFTGSSGHPEKATFSGVYAGSGEPASVVEIRLIPLAALSILVPVLALASIILFRNRRIQLRFVFVTLAVTVLLILVAGSSFFYLVRSGATAVVPSARSVIPLISLILIILAVRGIRKDEDLVRSYDRLR